MINCRKAGSKQMSTVASIHVGANVGIDDDVLTDTNSQPAFTVARAHENTSRQ